MRLAEMGVPVKYGHAETGRVDADATDSRAWEQHEIELSLQPLPEAADAVALTQWVLRNLAQRHGMECNFAPIVRSGHAGSGMHFHFAPYANGVYRPHTTAGGNLTDEAKWLICGLVEHGAALMAFGNPVKGSFVRLSQGKDAPIALTWGRNDRKALIRIPIVPTDSAGRPTSAATIEFRLPDASAHPHLLLAGVAQALLAGKSTSDLDGLLARTTVTAQGPAASEHRVPLTPGQVADAVVASRAMLESGGIFTPSLLDHVIALLRA